MSKITKQERAEKLFANTPIKKAIWIVAIPSLLSSLMFGLYTFIDQVFLQKFVPDNRNIWSEMIQFLPDTLNFLTSNELKQKYLDIINNSSYKDLNLGKIDANGVVSMTTAAIQPLIIFSNSIVFLVPVGASIYYTKCISKKLEKSGRDLWATMFWMTVALSFLATLMSFIFIWSGLVDAFAGKTNIRNLSLMTKEDNETLQAFYDASRHLSVHWAKQYVYIYALGTILQGLSMLLSYFIRAEGYNAYVMGWVIGANIVNVVLDWVFIVPCKMGVLGGVVATIIGWSINLTAYLAYVVINSKRNKTWLSLGHLFKFKFNKKLLLPTFALGFSGFIRSFGVAISFAVMNIFLTKTTFAEPLSFQYYWSKGMPIVSLFLVSIFGINDGARSLMSYNYTRRNFKRCKEVYLWTMLAAVIYSILAYSFVAATADNLWLIALNVQPDRAAGTTLFIRIVTLRVIALSLSISSLLVFQGTNDIGKSIMASIMENFITFAVIMPSMFGIAIGIFNKFGSKYIANWIMVAAFIANALVASIILLIWSYIYVSKVIPKIDQAKLTWSRKLEHKFFAEAAKLEEEYKKQLEQENDNNKDQPVLQMQN